MITRLYQKYFQKSRSFIYPILGINKKDYSPVQTFVALDDRIAPEDMRLVCLFEHKNTPNFKKFEEKMLLGNPLFLESVVREDGLSLYIFDFSIFHHDWDMFLAGKYSKLSPEFKLAIRNYYGINSGDYEYIDTYLYPDRYHKLYSTLLDEPLDIIKSIEELCNPFDSEKELLKFTPELEKV